MKQVKEKDTIQILDKSLKQGFTAIPRMVLKNPHLTMQAKVIFALLLDYAWQKGSCFPGQDRLANDLSVHRNTIIKHLKELKEYGLISWKQRGLNQTNIYYINPISKVKRYAVEPLDAHSSVSPESHSDVNQESHPSVNLIEEVEYKKKEYKKPLTLGSTPRGDSVEPSSPQDNDNESLNTFDTEAVAIAQELNDEKSIKYYQKIINLKNRGEIKDEDIQSALNDTRRMIRTDQVDGTSFLRNPASWFVSVLKKLMQKNDEKQKQEKYQEMISKFKENFISKTHL